MSKGATVAYEKIGLREGSDDEIQEEEVEAMSSEVEAPNSDSSQQSARWCTVRRNTNVPTFGDAARYVGQAFTRKTSDVNDAFRSGTIVALVRKRDLDNGKTLYFKLVDEKTEVSTCVQCKIVMSTSKKNIYKVCDSS